MRISLSCWLIFIFISTVASSECSQHAFIRIQAVTTSNQHSSAVKLENISLSTCIQHCNNASTCYGFVYDHLTGSCNSFDDDQRDLRDNLHPNFASDVFHKICLEKELVECEILWHFDLSLAPFSSGFNHKEISNVQSYEECLTLCLKDDVQCQSGRYNEESQKCIINNLVQNTSLTSTNFTSDDWIYFNNLCAISLKFHLACNSDQKLNSNATIRSSIYASRADNITQCQEQCENESSFICSSYSFNSKNHTCSLSCDVLSTISSPADNDTIHGQCTIPSMQQVNGTISSRISKKKSRTPLTSRCQGTITYNGYEKVTGYRFTDDYIGRYPPLYSNESRGITEECLRLCTEEKCLALSLNYKQSECSAIVPEEAPVHKALSFSYFRPICISDAVIGTCNKLWVVDRLPQFHLNVDSYNVIEDVSKEDCIARCLKESDRCRSANYHSGHRECSLCEADRHSHPDAFVPRQETEYLENQCMDNGLAIRPRQFSTSCTYGQPMHDKYLEFVDRTVTVATEAECRQACDSELLFNCRSYSFIPRQPSASQCFLSSDTTNSPGAQLRDQPGAVYVERTCTQNPLPPSQQPPVVPPTFPNRPNIPTFPQPPGVGVPQPPGGPFQRPPGVPGFGIPPPMPPGMPPGMPSGYPGFMPPGPRCFYPTDFTFEKTMGMVPRPNAFMARSMHLPLVGPQSIAPDCTRSCIEGDMHCISFVLQYPISGSPSCVTFDRGVGLDRNVLVPKQDAAFFEKICLHGRRCGKLWTFERVVGFELEGSDTKVIQFVPSKEDCEDHCLSETTFECRSAEYIYSMRMCRLSTETRRSRPEAFRFVSPDVDYLENQCASEPVQCEYTESPAKLLPFADRFVPAMASLQECQQKCEKERDFLCRAVTWNHVTTDCLLSGDDRYSTPMGVNVLVDRTDWVYSEKGNCGQVHVDCTPNEMLVRVVFGTPFGGRVYAKGNPQMCTQQGGNQLQITVPVPLGVQCGTVQEAPGIYTNEIVIQQHPLIMTDSDKSYRVVCSFAVVDQIVTMDSGGRLDRLPGLDVINVKGAAPKQVVQNTAPSPAVRLRIAGRNGQDVSTVGIGDELQFRVEVEPNSAFGIFARNLIARSEFGDQLILLDQNGCPTDLNIFPPLMPEPNSRALVAPFHAFRFPTTGRINFEVHITFCQEMCPPAQCMANDIALGRRKRTPEKSTTFNTNSTVHNYTMDANPYNPASVKTNVSYFSTNYSKNWQLDTFPTKIPLPSAPAFVPLPIDKTFSTNNSPVNKSRGEYQPELLNQVPLRLSLVVNNQEDESPGHRGQQHPPQQPQTPTHYVNPAIMRRYDGPIIRDPGFPPDKVCTDKSTIVAAILATIITQLIFMGIGIGIYTYYKRKRRRNRRPVPLHTPHNLLYETATTNVLRPLGMRDKLPPQHNTLKVSNWIQQQQKRNHDPNKINIMEM